MNQNIWMLIIVTFILFIGCVGAMAVGLMLRGRIMRGGCGSTHVDKDGNVIACESCSKKALNLCDEESSPELARASFAATMGRFERK